VGAGNVFGVYSGANKQLLFGSNAAVFPSTGGLDWVSGALGNSIAGDTGLMRNSAGVVEITSGTTTGCATLANCRDLRLRHQISAGSAPTIASGFAASGSTIAGADESGAVTIGSTTPGNTGAITFGTAFGVAPSCQAQNSSTASYVQASASTATLTLNNFALATGIAANWTAADVVTWNCKGHV
jgi:hypothetical protein